MAINAGMPAASGKLKATALDDRRSLHTFQKDYYAWLANRAQLLSDEDLPDNMAQALYNDVENRGKTLVTTSVDEADREWVAIKFEVIRQLLGCQAANCNDQRLWLILGALEADLMAAVAKLEAIDDAKAWAELAKKQSHCQP